MTDEGDEFDEAAEDAHTDESARQCADLLLRMMAGDRPRTDAEWLNIRARIGLLLIHEKEPERAILGLAMYAASVMSQSDREQDQYSILNHLRGQLLVREIDSIGGDEPESDATSSP